MDTVTIRAFLRVADLGNLTRAAEALDLSQPKLSRMLHALEEEVGVTLFHRVSRGMILTDAGTQFRHSVDGILRQLDKTVSDLRAGDHVATGHIKIGLPIAMPDILNRPLATWLARTYSAATFSIVTGANDEIEIAISDGAVDIAVLMSPQTRINVAELKPLVAEPLVLIAAKGKHLPPANKIGRDFLKDVPLILPPRRNYLRRRIEEFTRRVGFEPHVIAEVNHPQLIVALVEEGVGYSVLPGSASHAAREAGRLVGRQFTQNHVIWTLARSGRVISPRLDSAVEQEITRLFRIQIENGLWKAADSEAVPAPHLRPVKPS
jgi:LysR family transcriptional regulator, nitrogen assimilation regulatory protein